MISRITSYNVCYTKLLRRLQFFPLTRQHYFERHLAVQPFGKPGGKTVGDMLHNQPGGGQVGGEFLEQLQYRFRPASRGPSYNFV